MGFYPSNIAQDVTLERLRRFFIKEDAGFRVKKEIREMVVFAHSIASSRAATANVLSWAAETAGKASEVAISKPKETNFAELTPGAGAILCTRFGGH